MGKITSFNEFKEKKEDEKYNLDRYGEMCEKLAKGKISREEFDMWEKESVWNYIASAGNIDKNDPPKQFFTDD